MWQIDRGLSLIAFLAIALLILPSKTWAAEGIDVKVVAEWPVDIPGVEKMQLRTVEFQPGASLTDFEVKFFEFCNATQGDWAVKKSVHRRDRLAYRRKPVAHAVPGHQGQYHQPGKRTGRSVCLQADRKGDVMPGDAFGALRWALAELVTAWIGLAQPGMADERVEGAPEE